MPIIQDSVQALNYTIIPEHEDIDLDGDNMLGDAFSITLNAVDDLINELEESEVNWNKINKYICSYQSYNGYNRRITDFGDFMTENERKYLIVKGMPLFISEIIEHWSWSRQYGSRVWETISPTS